MGARGQLHGRERSRDPLAYEFVEGMFSDLVFRTVPRNLSMPRVIEGAAIGDLTGHYVLQKLATRVRDGGPKGYYWEAAAMGPDAREDVMKVGGSSSPAHGHRA